MYHQNIFSPDSNRPLMIIRLRSGHEKPEVWHRLFYQLLLHKGCCDEVWFSTGVGMPLLEKHKKRSGFIAEYAPELRAAGITPSLQIQATLGHSDDITAAAGAEGKNWGSYMGIHGEQCQYVNCPRQPGFLEYFRYLSEIYAQWHPGSVWIDDDLRLFNHSPAADPCGCYCPYCLELFGKEEGRIYSREELVSACENDPELFNRWKNFGIRSLVGVVQVIVNSFRRISPETRFGLQHCFHSERLAVFEALKEQTSSRIGSRPGGGAYSDHHPYSILDKALLTSMQIAEQPGYECFSQICAEIESCPRSFTCKTSRGHRIESLLYLAAGADSLSYFIMDPDLETPEWFGRELLAPLAAEAPCYKEFIRHNENTLPGGIGTVCNSTTFSPLTATGLPLAGTPFAFCSSASCGKIILPLTAEKYPENELEKLFRSGTVLDGYGAMILQQRGMNRLFGNIRVVRLNVSVSEYYTDDPLNEGFESSYHSPLKKVRFAFEVPSGLDVRILGVYRDNKGNVHGNASLIFTVPGGGRCALLGYEGFDIHSISSDRARQLNRVADWVSGETLPVFPEQPVQCLLVPRITEDGTLRSVTVLNPTIGNQRAFEVMLRGVPQNIAEAEFLIPGEGRIRIPLCHSSKGCKAILPSLAPWGIGWLKIPF